MKLIRSVLAVLLAVSVTHLRAEVPAAPAGAQAPAKPALSCPCDNPSFKPLNEKAVAVADYWAARRKYKVALVVASGAVLIALLSRNGGTMNEAQQAFGKAQEELNAARSKAEALGGLKVTGDDATEGVELQLKKDVDYALTP